MTPEQKRARHAAHQRAWRARNREQALAADRRYYRANAEKWVGRHAPFGSLLRKSQRVAVYSRARARRFGCEGDVTPAELRDLVGPCYYCGGEFEGWDHQTPLCRGGRNDAANIVPACSPCNRSKGRRTPEEWRAGVSVAKRWAAP